MKKINSKNNEEKNKEKNRKIILIIITIIIIVLALITSCSCTSKFWGRIGDLFRNEGTYVFKETDGAYCENGLYCETIINKDLRFDKDYLNVSVSDENIKLTYTFTNINPHEFTCSTSDANIATCYVNKDGYVVINPKSEGKVTIFLQTEENDRIYQATADINIGKPTKGIFLSNNAGIINLKQTNTKTVSYRLVGIDGKISVTSSDEEIATATIKDGILKMTAYKTGKVTFTITVEDNGKTYTATYTLTVVNKTDGSGGNNPGGDKPVNPDNPEKPGDKKDSNNKLSNLTTNKGTLSPAFKEDVKNYQVNVSANDNDITLKATPSSNKATVTYTFNGKTNTTGKIEGLEPGANVVTITVKAEDGSTNIYTVVVNKPGKPDVPKDHDSSLGSLTTNKGDVSPTFDPNTKEYSKDVNASDTSITILAKPNSDKATVTYTFDGVTNATGVINNLKPGANKVVVTVTAEDGSQTSYTVTVNRPHTYEVKFENNTNDCYLEDGTCLIKYHVYKDGVEQFDFNPNEINLSLPDSYKGTATIGTGDKLGYVVLKPDTKEMLNKTVDLTLTYNGISAITKVNFKSQNYYLQSLKNEYDMSIDSESNTRPVMFQTNLFDYIGNNPEDLKIEYSSDKKSITITSKNDPNIYLKIWTDSSNIDSISYDPKAGTSYLPIIVSANSDGTAHLYAEGSAFGKNIPDQKLDIKLNIIKKYLVIIDANGGMFNEVSKEYDFKISSSEKIDLSKLDEPILIVPNDECYYYEFIGYAKKGTTDIIYSKEDIASGKNNFITGITEDTTFVAIYDETQKIEREFESKTMWLVDVPLFHNEEYYNKYGEDKVIYPGAKGEYTMIFKNESPDDITLTGMILEEDTICVDIDKDGIEDGCLNMGYIVRSDYADASVNNYLYGASNKYTILHNDGVNQNVPKPLYTYRKELVFDESTKNTMNLPAGSNKELEITIHWEWAFYIDDKNDKIDTAIGNQAAASAIDKTLNDMYKLKVGIKYDVENKKCAGSIAP
jgi:hypothetical protein